MRSEYWTDTWRTEGVLSLSLPSAGGTDGGVLRDQVRTRLFCDAIV